MEWAANITTANWVGLLQVSLFVFIILLGFPMAFTLLAMSVIFGYYAFFDAKLFAESGVFANRIFDLIVKNTFSTMENHVLIAIPLFLLMGYVVEKAGIVARLFNAIRVATYKLPGNLAVASLNTSLQKINSGNGTASKLMNDSAFYNELQGTLKSINTLVDDIKVHPKRYINVSVFGKKDKSTPLDKPLADSVNHE